MHGMLGYFSYHFSLTGRPQIVPSMSTKATAFCLPCYHSCMLILITAYIFANKPSLNSTLQSKFSIPCEFEFMPCTRESDCFTNFNVMKVHNQFLSYSLMSSRVLEQGYYKLILPLNVSMYSVVRLYFMAICE